MKNTVATKKTETFKRKAEALISKLEDLVEQMPFHGNSSSESQKVCLQNALNNFHYTVNGVERNDFLPSEEY